MAPSELLLQIHGKPRLELCLVLPRGLLQLSGESNLEGQVRSRNLGLLAGVGCSERLASALPWLPHSVITSSALATLTGAVVGSSVDSLLGATVQVQYECSACATTTERLHHCGCKTKRASGLGWISNDIVNAVCTLLGCVVSAIIFLAID